MLARVIAFALLVFTTACGPCSTLPWSHSEDRYRDLNTRSGTADDDYVESPFDIVSGSSSDGLNFSAGLDLANKAIELLRAGHAHSIYAGLASKSFRNRTSESEFNDKLQLSTAYGPIREYKPMQWSFAYRRAHGRYLVYCTKLVEHEKGRLRYIFEFEGFIYGNFIGFDVLPYTGVHDPAELGNGDREE